VIVCPAKLKAFTRSSENKFAASTWKPTLLIQSLQQKRLSMQIDRPSISSSRSTRMLILYCVLGMAGCTTGSSLMDSNGSLAQKLRGDISDGMDNIQTAATAGADKIQSVASNIKESFVPLKPTVQMADTADLKIKPAADVSSKDEPEKESEWCVSLREKALADSSILRSPVLSGSVDRLGKADANIGLSYSSFRKASLGEAKAEAECRKFMAETSLQKLVFTSPQNLTAAGFRSKANAVESARMEMVRLRQNIKSAMQSGAINHEKATGLFMLIDQLYADGQASRSQADRRYDERTYSKKAAAQLESELMKAQGDLYNIESQTRTADNVDVGIQAGYTHYLGDAPIYAAQESQGVTGKVSFSMRLGVIDPRRFEHERLAAQAAQRAITTEESSPIWQLGLLRRSHERAIAGLEHSIVEIDHASSEAKRLVAILADVSQPEFQGARLNAKFQLLKLRADRAGLVGSVIEIKNNLRRLKDG
jgi:hypothetical protein